MYRVALFIKILDGHIAVILGIYPNKTDILKSLLAQTDAFDEYTDLSKHQNVFSGVLKNDLVFEGWNECNYIGHYSYVQRLSVDVQQVKTQAARIILDVSLALFHFCELMIEHNMPPKLWRHLLPSSKDHVLKALVVSILYEEDLDDTVLFRDLETLIKSNDIVLAHSLWKLIHDTHI